MPVGCRYQRYLDSVLESTEEFHEVADLMARHATLAATQADLKQQQAAASDAAERAWCARGSLPVATLHRRSFGLHALASENPGRCVDQDLVSVHMILLSNPGAPQDHLSPIASANVTKTHAVAEEGVQALGHR